MSQEGQGNTDGQQVQAQRHGPGVGVMPELAGWFRECGNHLSLHHREARFQTPLRDVTAL